MAKFDVETALPSVLEIQGRTLEIEDQVRKRREVNVHGRIHGERRHKVIRAGIRGQQLDRIVLCVLECGHEQGLCIKPRGVRNEILTAIPRRTKACERLRVVCPAAGSTAIAEKKNDESNLHIFTSFFPIFRSSLLDATKGKRS